MTPLYHGLRELLRGVALAEAEAHLMPVAVLVGRAVAWIEGETA